MKQVKFTESIKINSSDELVFDYTQDYESRLKWDPFLKKANLINGAIIAAKGVQAFCVANNGIGMITEYVTYTRPKVTAIKMVKGPVIFKSFLGSWMFKNMGTHKTEVVFLYAYQLRFPFNLLGFLIKRNLQQNVKLRLKYLKENIEKTHM